jgi:hypothetical protein
MYTVLFISFVVSSKCFGCFLHPSSGAQLPRTAIGCVWFWCVIPLEQVLVWDTLTLKHGQFQTRVWTRVWNWPCLSVKVSQTSTFSNGITHQTVSTQIWHKNYLRRNHTSWPRNSKTDPMTHTSTKISHETSKNEYTQIHIKYTSTPLDTKTSVFHRYKPMAVRSNCSPDDGCK